MYIERINLWKEPPGLCEEIPTITYYKPDNKKTDAAVIIYPGGGYTHRAPHEGDDYGKFLAENGISAFVVDYRVSPHSFPLPLLDARRGVRYVRYYAKKYGIDKNKIAVMGSSAGGHLAALTSTYTEPIAFESLDAIDNEDFIPNAQILCYPVINLYDKAFTHIGSGNHLIGDIYDQSNDVETRKRLTPSLMVNPTTPKAFIWHTFEDASVNIQNSLEYAAALKKAGVFSEIHLFPDGWHGLGLAQKESKMQQHVAQWSDLLLKWISYIDWLE